MENITSVLGAAPGIQWQGEKDNTQSTAINEVNVGIVVGQFKRGRLTPFRVSAATIEQRLGYDPTNFDYMAVQDVLDLGVPYVWVQRIRAGVAETNVETGVYDNYTPIEHHIFINESSAITLGVGAVANPANTALKITFALHDILDEGCDLEVKFAVRAGASLTDGKPTAINDILATLTLKDTLTKKQLYSVTGLLATNTKGFTLAKVAEDSNIFSSFVVSLLGDDADTAEAIITGLAGNLPNTLGRKKVSLTIPAMAGANETIPASFYELMANRLSYGDLRPNYLVIAQTDNLSLITCLMRIAAKRNCMIFGDIDPQLPLDSAMAVSSGIEAKTSLVSWFFNATKSRPRDAETISGAKVFRPSVGVLLGYTLLRNANTNKQGIPPLHIPIAGYDYPLPFKGMELRDDIFYDQDTLDRLAEQGVAINPVILHQGNDGSRFIFGDLKTQYDDDGDSPLILINSTEIIVYTANGVLDIISRYLRTGMDNFIEFAERDCRRFLDNCFGAGLLKEANNLGGKPYTLSITPREDRPFDAVDVFFARRPAGAARAAFLNTSVEK